MIYFDFFIILRAASEDLAPPPLPGQFTSHLAELQKAAKAAQEKELRQGGHFTLMRQAVTIENYS